MNNQNSLGKIRLVSVRFGSILIGLGLFFIALMFIFSILPKFTKLQEFLIFHNEPLLFSVVLVMSGITFMATFSTWIVFETNTYQEKILNIVFNYGTLLIIFPGGITFLIGQFLLGDPGTSQIGMRSYIVGVFMLLIRNPVSRLFVK